MSIKAMHYDVKRKLNKVDSQQYKNLLVPEIDVALNEAYGLFIKMIAFPRFRTQLGFEKSQRTIDDIRPLVNEQEDAENQFIVEGNRVPLPEDYVFYLSSHLVAKKNNCESVKIRPTFVQHDDDAEGDFHHKSSYEWRTINARFNSYGVRFENDGSFEIEKFCLSYVRKPKYIHNAEDFREGGYISPSGDLLTGFENCELPDHTHAEITDIAVMLLTGELKIPVDFAFAKLKLNQLN